MVGKYVIAALSVIIKSILKRFCLIFQFLRNGLCIIPKSAAVQLPVNYLGHWIKCNGVSHLQISWFGSLVPATTMVTTQFGDKGVSVTCFSVHHYKYSQKIFKMQLNCFFKQTTSLQPKPSYIFNQCCTLSMTSWTSIASILRNRNHSHPKFSHSRY